MATAIVADLPAIEIVGNKFFYSNNGSQFYMKGVAYQQNPENGTLQFTDPLANTDACKRDIPYLQQLQTNVIRVYALNGTEDHTGCLDALQDAGIYVIADLSEPDLSINRVDPQWTVELLDRYISIIDEFANYTNILGFFAGNEVTNNDTNTDASAYVKAAIRDSKAYIKQKNYRSIPVGYSSNDDITIRGDLADYFVCDDNGGNADFFGINMYEWCGSSSFKQSGFETVTKLYENLGVPLFFSEYGCNRVTPRKFQEVATLYGPDMTDIWSGGIVYMYFQEENNYGLVSIDSSGSVSTMADFGNYKSAIAAISPSIAHKSNESSVSPTSCPTENSVWLAATALPPTPDAQVCSCMSDAAQCVVSSDVNSDDYADLFSYICDKVDCGGINGNGTSGVYGAYSPCSPEERLNFVLDLYYKSNGKDSQACDFSGSATTKKASVASSCSAVLSSAGTAGMGTVSGSISGGSATGGSGSGSGSGSASGSTSSASSSSTHKNDASLPRQNINTSLKAAVVGITVAFGAGLFLL